MTKEFNLTGESRNILDHLDLHNHFGSVVNVASLGNLFEYIASNDFSRGFFRNIMEEIIVKGNNLTTNDIILVDKPYQMSAHAQAHSYSEKMEISEPFRMTCYKGCSLKDVLNTTEGVDMFKKIIQDENLYCQEQEAAANSIGDFFSTLTSTPIGRLFVITPGITEIRKKIVPAEFSLILNSTKAGYININIEDLENSKGIAAFYRVGK